MGNTVYIETSIIGYLTSRMSADLIAAANQRLTRDWWDEHRHRYHVVVSAAVIAECESGDPAAAGERMAVLAGIESIDITPEVESLAGLLIDRVPLPARAHVDALHIAAAAIHGIRYLLTWNCKHIANAALAQSIANVCRSVGAATPIMCTPQQLMED